MHHYQKTTGNTVLERIYQAVVIIPKTKDLANIKFDAVSPLRYILASITYAVGCSYNRTLQATPGKLVFRRDMLLDIYFQPNYKEIWPSKKTYQQ